MFNKKKCKKCNGNIKGNYEFCPYCGNSLNENTENWGMLGKNDFSYATNEVNFPRGFNMIFNSLMKDLNKQMREFGKEENKNNNIEKKNGISISISSFGNSPPKITVKKFGEKPIHKEPIKKIPQKMFTQEKIKKFSNLPREEPKTSIRRFADRVVYEVEMPGVDSPDNISIIRLETSIEIKAIGKNKAYSKIIPINLPIVNYVLVEGKLVLEFRDK